MKKERKEMVMKVLLKASSRDTRIKKEQQFAGIKDSRMDDDDDDDDVPRRLWFLFGSSERH